LGKVKKQVDSASEIKCRHRTIYDTSRNAYRIRPKVGARKPNLAHETGGKINEKLTT